MKLVYTLATLGLVMMLSACGDSPTTPAAAPASTQERIEKDLKVAGERIKSAAGEVAREAEPALQRAKEEARTVINRTAEKVADMTAPTQPAPTTAPGSP
jgi:hypothetical protein